jgi:hypothetical protein
MTKHTPGNVIISLVAVVAGVFLFRKFKCTRRDESAGEDRLDEMVEQSFPASDAPAY